MPDEHPLSKEIKTMATWKKGDSSIFGKHFSGTYWGAVAGRFLTTCSGRGGGIPEQWRDAAMGESGSLGAKVSMADRSANKE